MVLGSPPHDVAPFPLQSIGQVGYGIAACSFKSNRALITRTAVAWPTDWWLVRLSDGAVLRHKAFPPGSPSNIVGSDDASYIAENPSQIKPDPGFVSAGYTVIRSTADGAEAGRLTEYAVLRFSGDGSLVLAVGKQDLYRTGPARIIEWRTGRVLWTGPDGQQLNEIRALPGGRDFALAFSAPEFTPPGCGQVTSNPCQQVIDPLRDIVIVHGDGSATPVPGRYRPVW